MVERLDLVLMHPPDHVPYVLAEHRTNRLKMGRAIGDTGQLEPRRGSL
jgi:hypothetical protein